MGEVIANNSTTLWSGTLSKAVRYDEYGNVATGRVWTGSDEAGIKRPGGSSLEYCGNWTNQSSTNTASVGVPTATDSTWSKRVSFNNCSIASALYCIRVNLGAPTATPTATHTRTNTSTVTNTATFTNTATPTSTSTYTSTLTPTPTRTPTPTQTYTPSPTPTPTLSSLNAYGGSRFESGASPESIASGDFNNDGIVDLAVSNVDNSNIALLRGTGYGQFAAPVFVSVGQKPQGVTSGDFNQDGKLDLAVANHDSGTLTILRGNGTGGFSSTAIGGFGGSPSGITAADVNKDGKLDLLVTSENWKINVLLGTGSGTFGSISAFNVGNKPNMVKVGDFNEDGNPDLAVSNWDSNELILLLVMAVAVLVMPCRIRFNGIRDQ